MYLRSVVPYYLSVRFTLAQKQTLHCSQRPHYLVQVIISKTYYVLLSPLVIILLSEYIIKMINYFLEIICSKNHDVMQEYGTKFLVVLFRSCISGCSDLAGSTIQFHCIFGLVVFSAYILNNILRHTNNLLVFSLQYLYL